MPHLYPRAMLVEYSSTAQCKLMQEQRENASDRRARVLMSSSEEPMAP